MKMEVVGWYELLTAYIKQHYSDRDVLVICQDNIESVAEFDTLMNDLEKDGFAPPHQMRGTGYLIIEMERHFAKSLIDRHAKGGIPMAFWEKGRPAYDDFGEVRDL